MPPTTIDVPMLFFRAEVGAVDDSNRTVDLVWTTGSDVIRFDWATGKKFLERLSLDPKHVRLDRLNNSAPLLNTHGSTDLADIIGVVEPDSAKIAGKEGRARVRFSKRADVEPIYQDVRDKIIRKVSVGYRISRFEESEGKSDIPVRLAIDWSPHELSLVPIAADDGANVRSGGKPVDTNPCVIVHALAEDADRVRRFRLARARC